jgi:hypothetical protein
LGVEGNAFYKAGGSGFPILGVLGTRKKEKENQEK